ncbi:MAG: hypothetical protein ACKVII_06805 [Planctomycetales bacterium]
MFEESFHAPTGWTKSVSPVVATEVRPRCDPLGGAFNIDFKRQKKEQKSP